MIKTVVYESGSIPTMDFGAREEFKTSSLWRCCRHVQVLHWAITFKPKLNFEKDYSRWEVVSGRTASSKSKFELVQYVLHKLMNK